MINIKLEPNKITLKNALYLLISIMVLISISKIVFSKELYKNINNFTSPEEELAIKYCDAINKKIFNGLNKENLLKYEYYFSNLNIPNKKEPEKFFENFKLKLKEKCSYVLTYKENMEFMSYIIKFLN